MSVVIQEMIPARSSLVMMTVDPLQDGSLGAMEFTWGACEALVAGMVSPDEVVFDRETGRFVRTTVGTKRHRVVYDKFRGLPTNCTRITNRRRDQARLSIDEQELSEVINLGRSIEGIFGGTPQDIEAVIDPSGRIVVTQTRPITALPEVWVRSSRQTQSTKPNSNPKESV